MKILKFAHITKTGGTSIENCAKDKNILWGRFDVIYKKLIKYNSHDRWHRYIYLLPKNIRNKYDWFIVVRNPYTRIISEVYCKWGGLGEDVNKLTKIQFNNYIIFRIKNRNNLVKRYTKYNIIKMGTHYSEQYKYLINDIKIHVLKFENLTKDFEELMKKYKLNIILNKKDNNTFFKKYTIDDLFPKTIKLINNVYKKDFMIFNYRQR